MITFCVICYGCRGKQINRALSQLHFSSSLRAHISQTLVLLCLFYLCSLLKSLRCSVSYRNLMRNAASDCTWGLFTQHLPRRCLAKYCANSAARASRFSVRRLNWPQMSSFAGRTRRKRQEVFPRLHCSRRAPEFQVIIYLICWPNKLLTLIFVSQRVSL